MKSINPLFIIVVFLGLIVACGNKSEVKHSANNKKTYSNDYYEITIPRNWKIDESNDYDDVTFDNPGPYQNIFIMRIPGGSITDFDSYVHDVAEGRIDGRDIHMNIKKCKDDNGYYYLMDMIESSEYGDNFSIEAIWFKDDIVYAVNGLFELNEKVDTASAAVTFKEIIKTFSIK